MSKCKLKLTSVFLTIVLVLTLFPAYNSFAATIDHGTCGNNVNWSLSDTGVLTISGSGNMTAWDNFTYVPWGEYRERIKSVVFSGSVTSISKGSFYGCKNLTSVNLPESLTYIGGSAFCQCESLTGIVIPNNVTLIDGSSAFEGCSSLKSITISSKLTRIPSYFVYGCTNLTSITIPNNVTSIGNRAFYNCSNLRSITLPAGLTGIGESAFTNCDSLTDIYFGGTRDKFIGFQGYSSINKSVNIHYGTTTPALSITSQPKNYSGAAGSKAIFSITAKGTGLTYQWQYYSGGKWNNFGSNSSQVSLTVSNAHNGMQYRCIVKDSYGKSVTSNVATITITGSQSLQITTQPKNYSGAVGGKATFSVVAQGTGLSYQWQYYSGGTWINFGSNKPTASITVSNSHNGMQYRCIVKDSSGRSVTSSVATIKITSTQTLAITSHPKDYTGSVGSRVTFSVVAQGSGLSYQWQYYSGGTWINFGTNKSTASLTVSRSHNGVKYRCIVKDSSGKSVTSNVATIRIT